MRTRRESDVEWINDGHTLRIPITEAGITSAYTLKIAGIDQITYLRAIKDVLKPKLKLNKQERLPLKEALRLYNFVQKLRQDPTEPLSKRRTSV